MTTANNNVVIRTEALTKRFGDLVALDSLDLEVNRGEVVGYLGPNGAGKTVTLRLLLGLLGPSSGRCELFGLDSRRDAVKAHTRLAYVPGEANLWPSLTGAETLEFLGRLHGRVDESYRDELTERFVFDPSKKVRAYSKGNRQKLSLIAALMTRSELLMFDEPTAGLDPLMEVVFRECAQEARENGQTIFLSSHIMSEVEALADRIAILRAGQLVEMGTLEELRHLSSLSLEATFLGDPPDLSAVPGVKGLVVTGQSLHCQVQGSLDQVVRALSTTNIVRLLVNEPSLEELFLAHYGSDHPEGESPRDVV